MDETLSEEKEADTVLQQIINREKERRLNWSAENEMLGLSEVENNGTVTLPDRVIEVLGLKPGDKVALEGNDDHTITVTKA